MTEDTLFAQSHLPLTLDECIAVEEGSESLWAGHGHVERQYLKFYYNQGCWYYINGWPVVMDVLCSLQIERKIMWKDKYGREKEPSAFNLSMWEAYKQIMDKNSIDSLNDDLLWPRHDGCLNDLGVMDVQENYYAWSPLLIIKSFVSN